jgi:hemerythrin
MTEPKKTPQPASSAARDRIDEEHHRLRELLKTLNQSEDRTRLPSLLDELREVLVTHFESEEGPEGLHKAVQQLAPRHVHHVEEVIDEHTQLLDSLDDLRERARTMNEGTWPDVQRGVTDLTERLREHEERENELFDDSLLTDLGGEG